MRWRNFKVHDHPLHLLPALLVHSHSLFFYIHCLFCSLRVVIGKMKKKKKTLGKTCDFLFFSPSPFSPSLSPCCSFFLSVATAKGLSLSLSRAQLCGERSTPWSRGAGGQLGVFVTRGKRNMAALHKPSLLLLPAACVRAQMSLDMSSWSPDDRSPLAVRVVLSL